MHFGQKLYMPIRLILACAIFLGAARVHPAAMVCSLKLCGTECPMHLAPLPEPEPVSCCDKKKAKPKAEPESCKCTYKAGKPVTPSTLKAAVDVPVLTAILVTETMEVWTQPAIEEISIPAPRCNDPPGRQSREPHLGRAPPVT